MALFIACPYVLNMVSRKSPSGRRTAARAKYIQMAAAMKLGCADLSAMAIHKIEAS